MSTMMKVIEAGGVAPATFDPAVPSSYSKLLLAIEALIAAGGSGTPGGGTSGASSLTANGYITLAGGLILQWVSKTVSVTITSGNEENGTATYGYDNTVTWPVAFSNCFGVLFGGSALDLREISKTNTGATFSITTPGPFSTYTVRAWALGI
jgi:hypothetical protein